MLFFCIVLVFLANVVHTAIQFRDHYTVQAMLLSGEPVPQQARTQCSQWNTLCSTGEAVLFLEFSCSVLIVFLYMFFSDRFFGDRIRSGHTLQTTTTVEQARQWHRARGHRKAAQEDEAATAEQPAALFRRLACAG